jgi:CRISPR-associated endonuclease/helicase Cas3
MEFNDFFRAATSNRDPYPYQARFAEASVLPHLLRAPTGAGKTATAVIGWLWRWKTKLRETPRRLVYCLPMRVLVEQSEREAKNWIKNLRDKGTITDDIHVQVFMGGTDTGDWHLYPEKPAVLIGTQDMLLSRALNRGYATSRFHWPIDFGLLNNDCLWVFDEPQLMASGVSTSAQLAGLRHKDALGTFGSCPSVWMSATLEPGWLDTIDFRGKFTTPSLELDEADYATESLNRRMTAEKTLAPLGESFSKEADDKEAKAVATKILEKHREAPGAQTLVVLNTVKRARKVYESLKGLRKKAASPQLLLIHSRFRPLERAGEQDSDGNVIRKGLNHQLQEKGDAAKDRIIVATQVVEAGVDISARTLVTELAPWASIVQRIGRCNRTGDDGPGRVFWIDSSAKDPEKKEDRQTALPYSVEELVHARSRLNELEGKDVSPQSLTPYKLDPTFPHKHVIRRRDLLDLFDTSPDLSGNDIDVSRFVRSDDPDTDVKVFWRDSPPARDWDAKERRRQSPRRIELCNVPIGSFKNEFLEVGKTAYRFDHLEGEWLVVGKRDVGTVIPGQVFWVVADQGGYDAELGWSPSIGRFLDELLISLPEKPGETLLEDATDFDTNSETPNPRTIAEHTGGVCMAVDAILTEVAGLLPDECSVDLRKAARWHDVGKAHAAFQQGMWSVNPNLDHTKQWAKSGKNGRLVYGRKHFRHELASALAAIQHALTFETAYLIAAHHGKVRLSIRALPGEEPPRNSPTTLFALGVCHKDELPPVELGGETCPKTELDLSPMQLGGNSWTGRALKLLDTLGPFRLAYLESLLRAADQRVSNAEQMGEAP